MKYILKATKDREIPFETQKEAEQAKLMLYEEGYTDMQIIECETIECITENCSLPVVISYTPLNDSLLSNSLTNQCVDYLIDSSTRRKWTKVHK